MYLKVAGRQRETKAEMCTKQDQYAYIIYHVSQMINHIQNTIDFQK